jgi:hypothetical protein
MNINICYFSFFSKYYISGSRGPSARGYPSLPYENPEVFERSRDFYPPKKKRLQKIEASFNFNPGDVLLSHTVARVVPLALKGLTAEFGMGSGVSPSL